jgi:3',5'-cyclic AMP phosphodiesterase CpdA
MIKRKYEMKIKSVMISLVMLVIVVLAMLLIILPTLGFTMFGREKSTLDGDAAGERSGASVQTQGDQPIFVNEGQNHVLNSPDELDVRIISDIHQLAPELRADNDVFEVFLNSGDGKLLKYSTEILEAFARTLDSDVLIVSGDLTTNAERATHLWLAHYFEAIEANGTQVFVIPGNHDIDNPYATGFETGKQKRVETVTAEDFADIYGAFGYDQAFSRDPASLSYVVRLTAGTFLLMLDTNKYEQNQTVGYPVMEGELRADTLDWLEEVNVEIRSQTNWQSVAVSNEPKIISVSHHNIISHSPVHSKGFVVENAEESAQALEEMGITLNFSGHIHIQDIEYDPRTDLTEIVSGSLIQYPQTYGVLKLGKDEMRYSTEWVDVEGYAVDNGLTDPFLLNFKHEAETHFREESRKLLGARLTELDYKADEINAMTETFVELNSRYFAGTDSFDKEEIIQSEGFKLWNEADVPFLSDYGKSMLLDKSDDNAFQKKYGDK